MIVVHQQGSVIDVEDTQKRVISLMRKRPSTPRKRGKITTFSKKSRRRLKVLLNRLEPTNLVFITLTVAEDTSASILKSSLHNYSRWLLRSGFDAIIWKMEFQKRGVIHFHLLALTWGRRPPKIPHAEHSAHWGHGFVWLRFVPARRGKRAIYRYLAKYVGKDSSLDAGDIPDNSHSDEGRWLGRFWGVYGRANLVFAVRRLVTRPYPALINEIFALYRWFRENLGFVPARFSFVSYAHSPPGGGVS